MSDDLTKIELAKQQAELDDHGRKIEGLSKSLDKAKEDIGGLRSQVGETRGLALSADRGFYTLSERVENLKSSQERIENTTGKHTELLTEIGKGVARLQGLIKSISIISALIGLAAVIYRAVTGG